MDGCKRHRKLRDEFAGNRRRSALLFSATKSNDETPGARVSSLGHFCVPQTHSLIGLCIVSYFQLQCATFGRRVAMLFNRALCAIDNSLFQTIFSLSRQHSFEVLVRLFMSAASSNCFGLTGNFQMFHFCLVKKKNTVSCYTLSGTMNCVSCTAKC